MSRLKTLTDYMDDAKTKYTGCYGADSLIAETYGTYQAYLSPAAPSQTFPSLLCKEIKECDGCCLNRTEALEDICRDLELSLTPDETSKVQQGTLPLF